eukprot:UN24607
MESEFFRILIATTKKGNGQIKKHNDFKGGWSTFRNTPK